MAGLSDDHYRILGLANQGVSLYSGASTTEDIQTVVRMVLSMRKKGLLRDDRISAEGRKVFTSWSASPTTASATASANTKATTSRRVGRPSAPAPKARPKKIAATSSRAR